MIKKVKVNKLKNASKLSLPKYETAGSAGMDLCAAINKAIVIKKGKYRLYNVASGKRTRLQIALPKSFEAQIRPRSGLAIKNGITVLNSPGTIDSDYRGEIGVILINHGEKDFIVKPGMRIAQMIISKVIKISLQKEKNLKKTTRGSGGFGSTGVE